MNERLNKIALRLQYRGDNGYGQHSWTFITDEPYLRGIACDNLLIFTKGKNIANAASHTLRSIRRTACRMTKPEYRAAVDKDVLEAIDALPDTHISRDEVIARMKKVAADFAERLGYDILTAGEDRQKGIWGEALTYYLERHRGSCTEELKWTSDTKPGSVTFRFRFATPSISIRTYEDGGRRSSMAVVEVDQPYDCIEKRNHGDWAVTETMTCNCWNMRSHALIRDIIAALEKADVLKR